MIIIMILIIIMKMIVVPVKLFIAVSKFDTNCVYTDDGSVLLVLILTV